MSWVTVSPDLSSTGAREAPRSTSTSISWPLRSRQKYVLGARPRLYRAFSSSPTTQVSISAAQGVQVQLLGGLNAEKPRSQTGIDEV